MTRPNVQGRRRQSSFLAGTALRRTADTEDGDMPRRFRNAHMATEWTDLALPVAAPPRWMRDALCAGPMYSDLNFFADDVGQPPKLRIQQAKAVCALCPVWSECLEDALEHEGDGRSYGVRGGLTAHQRQQIHAAEVAERPKNPDDVVYFAAKDGLIKIGHSYNLPLRMKALHMEFITSIEGGRELEQELHQRFAASRVRGEWFNPTPDLLAYIEWARERLAS